eukprot:762655-Hanusia_phi.AAC.2
MAPSPDGYRSCTGRNGHPCEFFSRNGIYRDRRQCEAHKARRGLRSRVQGRLDGWSVLSGRKEMCLDVCVSPGPGCCLLPDWIYIISEALPDIFILLGDRICSQTFNECIFALRSSSISRTAVSLKL